MDKIEEVTDKEKEEILLKLDKGVLVQMIIQKDKLMDTLIYLGGKAIKKL